MPAILLLPIAVPVIGAGICQLLPRKSERPREWAAFATCLAACVTCVYLFYQSGLRIIIPWFTVGTQFAVDIDLALTAYGKLILVAASVFALLTTVYSIRYMEGSTRHRLFYVGLLASLGMTSGVVLSNNMILLLLFWELLGVFLYLMILVSSDHALPAATKTLLMIGGADLAMMLGFGQLWLSTGTLTLSHLTSSPVSLSSGKILLSFILILTGAFAKGGVIPLHSWIPAVSTEAPIPVMAYLPAALDKLVSIFLIGQMCISWYVLTPSMQVILMAFGALTILCGVGMALIQSDFRKMLAFHNVSQVGYMVLGIGTGTAVGMAGGILHMLNLVILKGSLFLSGGAVERQTRQTRFSELGGLASAMPWTFAATFIAALGISGVPPLNAFVSKWLIYQGVLERGGPFNIPFLLAAMFGSALTLASFMKLMHSIFWGERPLTLKRVSEAGFPLVLPGVVLSFFVLLFGVFYTWVLKNLIQPILAPAGLEIIIPGIWQSSLAVILLLLSLLVGWTFYLASRGRKLTRADIFVGGEDPNNAGFRVPGTQFYSPIKTMPGLEKIFHLGEEGSFDLFNHLIQSIRWISNIIYEYIDQGLADLYQEVIPGLIAVIGKLMQLFNARLIPTYTLWVLYAAGFAASLLFPHDASVLRATQIIACAGMVGWGMLAWVETDLNRLLILAATSQLGFAVLGATLSAEAAFSYLLTGGTAIAALIVCGMAITRKMKTRNIRLLNGLASKMPVHFIVFLLAAFWLSGFPPFGSFYSKYLLGIAAEAYSPILSIIIAGTAFLTVGYFLRPIRRFLRAVGG
jgi:formate hydrogenlyase subunit 3/multisubunit Na+/H+ antiporter MnhD subunit